MVGESLLYFNFEIIGLGSIYPSLLAFFANWPELFTYGKIKFCKSPILIAKKGNDVKWFYNLSEAEGIDLKGYDIRYIKGLGSLTQDDYQRVIRDPHYDIVKLPENWKEQFEMLLGNDSQLRKDWMSS